MFTSRNFNFEDIPSILYDPYIFMKLFSVSKVFPCRHNQIFNSLLFNKENNSSQKPQKVAKSTFFVILSTTILNETNVARVYKLNNHITATSNIMISKQHAK